MSSGQWAVGRSLVCCPLLTAHSSLVRFARSAASGPLSIPLVLLVALLPALGPLAAPGMPATHDGHLHLQRIFELDQMARAGAPFSRWLPDLAYGYGLPLFNYYAPLAYLPAEIARQLGTSYVDSLKLAQAFGLAASGLTMFVLARSMFGPLAALTAGLVYAYLPYQMVNLYVRGALAETAAFAWLPILCWGLIRMADPSEAGGARSSGGVALATAGLVLTHNVTALFGLPAMAVLAVSLPAARRGEYVARVSLALGLGLGLAAWFWLPAIFERNLVQLGAAIEPELFESFFFYAWPPFQVNPAYDYQHPTSTASGSPIYWPGVGLVQLAVILAGAAALLRTNGPRRRVLLWAIGLVLACWALQLAVAERLFELLPLATFIQFPWRLLTLIGLGTALLAAGAVQVVPGRRGRRLLMAGLVVGPSIWAALAALVPSYEYPEDRFLTAETLVRADLADFGLGSTHGGEYLPVSTGQRNSTHLWKELRGNDTQRERTRPEIPLPYRVELVDWAPTRLRLNLSAEQADRLSIHQFYFPGWTAQLDGSSVGLQPGGRFGILAVAVSPGSHVLELSIGWTPLRLAGLALSLLAVLGLVGLVVRRGPILRHRSALVPASLVLLAATAGLLGVTWQAPPSSAQTYEGRSSEINGQLALVGSRLDAARLSADGPLTVRLAWLALTSPRDSYDVVLRAEAAADGSAHEAQWAYSPLMRSWERGELVETETDLRLPMGFPAGAARISLRVEPRESGLASPLASIPLGEVSLPVPRPAEPPRSFAVISNQGLIEGLELLSYELRAQGVVGRASLGRGELLDVGLEWRVGGPAGQELVAVVQLRGGRAETSSEPHTVGNWFNPPPAWQAADVFRQQLRLEAPADLPPGEYEVWLRVFGGERAWAGLAPGSSFAITPRGRPLAETWLGHLLVQP